MQRFFHRNGLSIFLLSAFLILQIGLSVVGMLHVNNERAAHGQSKFSYIEYLGSAHFLEATMENWESEFLQMAAYVFFTVFLFQQGSSESKDPDADEEDVDRDPRQATITSLTPWPVKRGGWILTLYENSLSLALFALFLISFMLHCVGGQQVFNEEAITHGQPTVSVVGYLLSSQFWFESLQNWQSEFLSIGVMVLLSIFLRQRGSPESKPVDAPHWETK